LPDFHQPDSRENWRDVWQSGNDYWRARAEVLCVDARDIRRIQAIKEGDKWWDRATRAKVVKNKGGGAVPRGGIRHRLWRRDFARGRLDRSRRGEGRAREERHVDQLGGERMGQGRENARVFLKENKDIRDKLENVLRKKMEIPVPGQTNAAAPGPNGHAAPAQGDKAPMKASAAIAGVDASKARPAR